MNTLMQMIGGLFLLVAVLIGPAWASGTEGVGNEPIRRVPGLSAEMKAVADQKSRVYWREINGDFQCNYKGSVDDVNATLDAFAKAGGKDVVLWPGAGRYETFEGKASSCDVALHVPGGLAMTMLKAAKTEEGKPVFEVEPTLTIYLADAIPLASGRRKITHFSGNAS